MNNKIKFFIGFVLCVTIIGIPIGLPLIYVAMKNKEE